MNNNAECPYCGNEVEIDHDDGYGYEEDKLFEQDCPHCGKTFGYRTTLHYYYDAKKVPCFNGEPHKWKEIVHDSTFYEWRKVCEYCGDYRYKLIDKTEHTVKMFGRPINGVRP